MPNIINLSLFVFALGGLVGIVVGIRRFSSAINNNFGQEA